METTLVSCGHACRGKVEDEAWKKRKACARHLKKRTRYRINLRKYGITVSIRIYNRHVKKRIGQSMEIAKNLCKACKESHINMINYASSEMEIAKCLRKACKETYRIKYGNSEIPSQVCKACKEMYEVQGSPPGRG